MSRRASFLLAVAIMATAVALCSNAETIADFFVWLVGG